MSRRGLVLEGYQAPSGSKEVDPMAGQRLVAEERMHNKTLEAQKEKKSLGDTNKAFEYIDKNYNPSTDKENSNVIQQKADEEMAAIKNEAFQYLKQNPNASQFEIAQMFGDRAFKVNQLYTKGRAFQENANKAATEIAKMDAGINPAQLSIEAQKQAFLDPQTGKVRDDISFVDPNDYGKYMDEAIKNSTMKVTSTEGLKNHIYNKDAIKTDTLDVAHQDSKKGLVREKVVIKIPQDYELEKNDKGFNVLDKEGRYSVVPKSETLPDGSKILDESVFNNLPRSYKERAWGEAQIGIKAYNMANGTNISMDSNEADKIARKFAYADMAKLWNNGGVERVVKKVEQPAPRITINNGGKGGDSDVKIRNVYKEIDGKFNENKGRFGEDYKIPLSELSATAQGVIIKYANELTGGNRTQSDMYVQKDNLGKYNIVDLESGKAIAPIDFTDVNIKVQPGVKEKREVVSQGNKNEQPDKPQKTSYTNITSLKDKSGKTVKAGVKNNKWYNIETGKEL